MVVQAGEASASPVDTPVMRTLLESPPSMINYGRGSRNE
ncbi:hypothetical protein XBKB1_4210006 [Xenorhabdus bovienii str. kraussei Becker Underwood]|uniref:Uncharacterized protein n=1 Tax=Xenorhabdus bovienii str. kraussei Becker Underwood TaxID=1398204 RepID=A0A077PXD4_XENBV|nr:hypothetical protein XBKB1_4210006 [Xenorhabdus bovienii str. kraussei Becker Underwood]